MVKSEVSRPRFLWSSHSYRGLGAPYYYDDRKVNNPKPVWLKMDMICREMWKGPDSSGVGPSGLQGLLINRHDISVEILMICPSAFASWPKFNQLEVDKGTKFGDYAKLLDDYGQHSYGRLLFHELTHSINAMGDDRGV